MPGETLARAGGTLWAEVQSWILSAGHVVSPLIQGFWAGLSPGPGSADWHTDWGMLALVIAGAALRQALLFVELAAPMCVLILVIGGVGWHLLHVFSYPKDKLYLWPFFDFDDDEYYALNEEEIDNLISVDPREPSRLLYTDDIFTWHEGKTYTYIHPRTWVGHWTMREAEEDPYGDMEDDAYQELKRADFVLGSDLYGEDETREETGGDIPWGQAPNDPPYPRPYSDLYTLRGSGALYSAATPITPVDLIRDEDEEFEEFERRSNFGNTLDFDREASIEGEVFGTEGYVDAEMAPGDADHETAHRFIAICPPGVRRRQRRAHASTRWYLFGGAP